MPTPTTTNGEPLTRLRYLVYRAINDGYFLTVADGEGIVQRVTSNASAILEAIESIEEGRLRIWERDEDAAKWLPLGVASFITGGDPDEEIYDYSEGMVAAILDDWYNVTDFSNGASSEHEQRNERANQ